jgi:hypothetical protein
MWLYTWTAFLSEVTNLTRSDVVKQNCHLEHYDFLNKADRKSYSRVGNTAYLAVECFVGDPLLTLLDWSQDYAVRSVDQFNSKPE